MYVDVYKSPQSPHNEVRGLVIERNSDFYSLPQEIQNEFQNAKHFKEFDLKEEDKRNAIDSVQAVHDIENYGYHIAHGKVEVYLNLK
jgi:uncharacterized protein YcgL (UPF0745 family)